MTGSGGGWGDPRRRALSAVVDDVRNGFVTVEGARDIYGWNSTLRPATHANLEVMKDGVNVRPGHTPGSAARDFGVIGLSERAAGRLAFTGSLLPVRRPSESDPGERY